MILQQKPICYVFLGKNQLWIVFKKERVRAEKHPEPLTIQQVIQACTGWNSSKIVLFLEPPWMLQTFQATIPLSSEDALQYSHNILGFQNLRPEKFSKIGLGILELSEKSKMGLFAAALSFQALKLIEGLQARLRVKVEAFPLLFACLPEFLQAPGEVCFFHGLSQVALLQKQDKVLQQIVLLPESISKESNPKIAEDFLNVSLENAHTLEFQESLALAAVKHWHKVQKKFKFEWGTSKISWKGSWKGLILAAWAGGMGLGLYGFFFLEETNQWRQNEIEKAQKQLQEGQVQIEIFKNYTAQRQQFMRVNNVYQHLKNSAGMAQQTLQQTVASLSDQVWIEYLHFEQDRLHLRLLTLNTARVPQILDELAGLSLAEKVVLKSQERVQVAQREVTKFDLQIQLKAHHVETKEAPNFAPVVQ